MRYVPARNDTDAAGPASSLATSQQKPQQSSGKKSKKKKRARDEYDMGYGDYDDEDPDLYAGYGDADQDWDAEFAAAAPPRDPEWKAIYKENRQDNGCLGWVSGRAANGAAPGPAFVLSGVWSCPWCPRTCGSAARTPPGPTRQQLMTTTAVSSSRTFTRSATS